MPRTKTKKKQAAPRDTRGLKVAALALLGLAGTAGAAYGVVVGVASLEERAASLHGLDSPQIKIAWPALSVGEASERDRPESSSGTWLPKPIREHLTESAARAVGVAGPGKAYSSKPLEAAGRTLARSGWFEGYPTVRRRAGGDGGVIEIRGTWRVPAAVVRSSGRDYLVAWDGKRLPLDHAAGTSGQRVLLGVSGEPPATPSGAPDFASAWPGGGVEAGLGVLRAVWGEPWAGQVTGIDLSRYEDERVIELLSDRGTRLVWGSDPDTFRAGEVSTETKLSRIGQLHARFGHIDGGQSRLEIHKQGPIVVGSGGGS